MPEVTRGLLRRSECEAGMEEVAVCRVDSTS